ncbi:MAG TPA: FAD-dependent oxidoreductase [Geminicoccaceae bacterium]|nr:FAD-dependent oxidoreductase [Geminicoccaceae bacterium]
MRIAIVGTGISGLAAAWLLDQRHDITVYEEAPRLGGHASTFAVSWQGRSLPVDTGFQVYNERNYPNLTQLFARLGVPTQPSDMSFAVSVDDGRLEYAGSSLRTLFAQKRNLLRPGFHRMWSDILRFNAEATAFLRNGDWGDLTLGDFLAEKRYGAAFCRHYLLPMGAAIWSATIDGICAFPARTFVQFFANHGLLAMTDRPQWRTVTGGSGVYVEKLSKTFAPQVLLGCAVRAVRRHGLGLEVIDCRGGRRQFDQVVLACHADQALAMLETPTSAERAILGAFRYQANRAVLHRDPALMPRRRAVWSSWNYLARGAGQSAGGVSVTYWLNRLQNIEPRCLLLESLNPLREPAPGTILAEFHYEHPQYDARAVTAQARLREIQGQGGLWFAGAHWGYGFHEDGLRSGLQVAAALGVPPSWWAEVTPIRRSAPRTMPERAAAQAV